eukprot:TRINITY_DN20408_c0_g1_i1.p1 TRINITY_DN20408_c0_g1~~TRINITY_DN20408_c0_g1_i1.p1  ORF type:complete len:661 (+),score=100.99 TRINITY_DN20408_c0_g1_i1:135-2117(+)
MDGPYLSNPAKRPFEQNANGASKRRPKPPPPPITLTPGHVAFRLLCHVSKTGGVIGKSGSVVKLFRQETGAKIRVEETVAACEERVILIVAPETPKKKISIQEGDGVEHEVSPAQEALIRVFERVLSVEADVDGVKDGAVSCRLLAPAGQVGSVMGKGGKVIEKIRKESGAKIRVLPGEQVPACASGSDELIQIMGDALAVKKALLAVSRCLQDSSQLDKAQIVVSRPVGTIPSRGSFSDAPHGSFSDARGELLTHKSSFLPPTSGSSVDYGARGRPLSAGVDRIPQPDQQKTEQEVSFRLLCSNDKVGGVIGKGGTIVRALQNETGASISVGASVAESDERVITISALENPESRYSPAQNAVLRVYNRSIEVGMEKGLESGLDKGAPVSVRLLVSSSQIGCLMGKGGKIILEMRKQSGAGIRILGGDQLPKCASENDEVVQINGEFGNVQDALFHVTSRLRDNIFPAKMLNGAGAGIYASTMPEFPSYGRGRDPLSPGLYPSMGLPLNFDRQTTLAQSMDHLGLSRNIDHPSPPRLWASQTVGIGNLGRAADTGRGLTTLRGGIELGSGSKSAIVTNTTLEIVVPERVIGFVYGENGSNLSRIRQISGAKVTVHDPRPGVSDGLVFISGTPDQAQAAQSLLQAFILSGRSSPDPHARLL